MSIFRTSLLWMSENPRMKEKIPRMKFAQKAVKKFMPGESVEAALDAAAQFGTSGIGTVFTKLGENLTQLSDAAEVRDDYLELIDQIADRKLDIEISVKLTQLGFDFSVEDTQKYLIEIAEKANAKLGNTVFIDMESSAYTQKTIDFYKECKKAVDNIGLCVQAYLFRTEKDIEELLTIKPSLRVVKGAYKEPTDIVFKKKSEVDENYFLLAKKLLKSAGKGETRVVFATHDEVLIRRITAEAERSGADKTGFEFQMLYGIRTALQQQLAAQGYKFRVLISYGESWYPWYLRRLAERPANVWFVVKNMF